MKNSLQKDRIKGIPTLQIYRQRKNEIINTENFSIFIYVYRQIISRQIEMCVDRE